MAIWNTCVPARGVALLEHLLVTDVQSDCIAAATALTEHDGLEQIDEAEALKLLNVAKAATTPGMSAKLPAL
tara:strand:+ start:1617 stop:1832 length:216 start_codon:yes stop_codon:yes gene_type:complete